MNRFTRRRLIRAGALTAMTAALASKGLAQSGAARPLIVGQVNLTFYTAAAGIVLEVLDRLGHATTTAEGSHPDIYARLGRSEVDILIAAWLPHAHGALHAPMAGNLVEAAVLYEDARLYWSVPAHVPVDAVRGIDDLKKPDVLARIDREIIGVGPGSGLMNGAERIMRQYGLGEAGYTLRVAPPAEWAARLERATAEGRWIVMPLWQPQYLNAVFPVRVLDEPQGVYGVDRAIVIVRRQPWDALPERSRSVLSRIALGIPVVTELERQIMVERRPPREAARA
jgi:glycine betaine/proline transport system substrate-binding protein